MLQTLICQTGEAAPQDLDALEYRLLSGIYRGGGLQSAQAEPRFVAAGVPLGIVIGGDLSARVRASKASTDGFTWGTSFRI